MSDLISRSTLIEALSRNSIVEKVYIGEKSVLDVVKAQPTIEAVEVKHGEWKNGCCTNCGQVDFSKPKFCPECGADMRKGGVK